MKPKSNPTVIGVEVDRLYGQVGKLRDTIQTIAEMVESLDASPSASDEAVSYSKDLPVPQSRETLDRVKFHAEWPCAFHVGPTPGCEMCRNEGGSGQRLELDKDDLSCVKFHACLHCGWRGRRYAVEAKLLAKRCPECGQPVLEETVGITRAADDAGDDTSASACQRCGKPGDFRMGDFHHIWAQDEWDCVASDGPSAEGRIARMAREAGIEAPIRPDSENEVSSPRSDDDVGDTACEHLSASKAGSIHGDYWACDECEFQVALDSAGHTAYERLAPEVAEAYSKERGGVITGYEVSAIRFTLRHLTNRAAVADGDAT